jgi:hypothetical protein
MELEPSIRRFLTGMPAKKLNDMEERL